MNYLSIDLGDKNCGIAYTNMGIVFAGETIKRPFLINFLKKAIKEKNISTIVVGLPYDLYGVDKKQLIKTKKFIDKLKDIFEDIKIKKIDERFTTFEAINILKESNEKNIKNKKDNISAYLILESYLKKMNHEKSILG